MKRFVCVLGCLLFAQVALAESDGGSAAPLGPTAADAAKIDTHAIAPLPPSAFAYDQKAPLKVHEEGVEKRGEVAIHDVRFASPSGRGDLVAYLVEPPASFTAKGAKVPGILFVHWLGETNANRSEFLDEAVGLAKKGALSVLVNGMWSADGWYRSRQHANDFADAIAEAKELNRAMDFLLSQKSVDPKRVAYVGHDFGAMYGVLAAAAQPRAKTYVFLAPTVTFTEWFLFGRHKPTDFPAYVKQMAALDPAKYVGKLAPAPVFLQFAKDDEFVSPEKQQAFADATHDPKLVRIYESATHAMTNADGLNDRYRWLAKELGLAGR